jgi:hypothetical protein
VRKVTVVVEAELAEPLPALCEEGLALLIGDATSAVMGALVALGAEAPAVSVDVEAPSLRVEVVADARAGSEAEALASGVQLIAGAFARAADALGTLGVGHIRARTVDRLPA